MDMLRLVYRYCDARNLIFREYLIGLFSGLTEDNIPAGFIEKQERYHLELLRKM
jgi:hypothetical protein